MIKVLQGTPLMIDYFVTPCKDPDKQWDVWHHATALCETESPPPTCTCCSTPDSTVLMMVTFPCGCIRVTVPPTNSGIPGSPNCSPRLTHPRHPLIHTHTHSLSLFLSLSLSLSHTHTHRHTHTHIRRPVFTPTHFNTCTPTHVALTHTHARTHSHARTHAHSHARTPCSALTRLARQHGAVYSLWFGQRLAVILNSHEVAREALVTKGDRFADRPNWMLLIEKIMKKKGEKTWRVLCGRRQTACTLGALRLTHCAVSFTRWRDAFCATGVKPRSRWRRHALRRLRLWISGDATCHASSVNPEWFSRCDPQEPIRGRFSPTPARVTQGTQPLVRPSHVLQSTRCVPKHWNILFSKASKRFRVKTLQNRSRAPGGWSLGSGPAAAHAPRDPRDPRDAPPGVAGLIWANGPQWKEMRKFAVVTMRDMGVGKKTLELRIQVRASPSALWWLQITGASCGSHYHAVSRTLHTRTHAHNSHTHTLHAHHTRKAHPCTPCTQHTNAHFAHTSRTSTDERHTSRVQRQTSSTAMHTYAVHLMHTSHTRTLHAHPRTSFSPAGGGWLPRGGAARPGRPPTPPRHAPPQGRQQHHLRGHIRTEVRDAVVWRALRQGRRRVACAASGTPSCDVRCVRDAVVWRALRQGRRRVACAASGTPSCDVRCVRDAVVWRALRQGRRRAPALRMRRHVTHTTAPCSIPRTAGNRRAPVGHI